MDYGWTRPAVVSRGEIPSAAHSGTGPITEELPATQARPDDSMGDQPKADEPMMEDEPTDEVKAPAARPSATNLRPAASSPRVARRQSAAQSDAFWESNFGGPQVQVATHEE
jgi:hypothetical protein